jgi:hypothetical protein
MPKTLGQKREHERIAQQIRNSEYVADYLKGNVLVCYRIRQDVPRQKLVQMVYLLQKCVFLANAAGFGKKDDTHYVVLIGTLDETSAESLRQNIANLPYPEIELCEKPADSAVKEFVPLGYVFPKDIGDEATTLTSTDPDLIESYMQGIASRMEEHPDEDFIFPNLPPELYEMVKSQMKKKPQ